MNMYSEIIHLYISLAFRRNTKNFNSSEEPSEKARSFQKPNYYLFMNIHYSLI